MDIGIIVDLETTGIDCEKDEIIEIGIIEFALGTGQEPTSPTCTALEDPGFL